MLLVGRLQCLVKEHKWYVVLFMRVIYVCLMAAMLHQCRDKPALVNMLQLKHESNHVFIKFSYYKNVISASSREQHFFICNRPSKKSLQYICCVTNIHATNWLTMSCSTMFLNTVRNRSFRKLLFHDYTQKTLISRSTSQAISTSLSRKLHFYHLRTNTKTHR